jgi:hypothetical protein
MKWIPTLSLGMMIAAGHWCATMAGPATFAWNPGGAIPTLTGGAFTADQISTTDFLFNRSTVTGIAFDDFVLNFSGVSRNGLPTTAPGLGISYGLYLQGHVTLHAGAGGISIYDSGTVSLIADPTNNDGAASAAWNPFTQTGGINFANPAGTADDVTLATGSLVSGSFGLQSNGQLGVQFVNELNPVLAEAGFFIAPTDVPLTISQALFNTATSRVAGSTLDGGGFITVNNGFGLVEVQVPEPASLMLLGGGVAGLLFTRRGRRV